MNDMNCITFVVLLHAWIFGFTEITAIDTTENVALNGDSWQSSTYSQSTESLLAVDGDTSTVNCSETDYQKNPWWTVDLGAMTYVYQITVVYGGNLGALSDLQVTLTNNPPSVSNPPPQFPVPRGVNESALPGPFPSSANGSGEVIVGVTINLVAALNSTPARYVVVRQQTKNDSLRLCEVKVNPNRIRGSVWSASYGYRMSVCIKSSSLSASLVECGLRCLLDINCLSFNHRPVDGVCQPIYCQPGSDVDQKYVIEDASFVWFNKVTYWRRV